MRISFVLQTYRLPAQVGRLIDTLNIGCPDNLIVVTHSGPLDGLAEIARHHRIDRALPAVPGRGRFGLIDSYICALRWLCAQARAPDWIVLMSGQDYPIRPLRELRSILEQSTVDGYFYHFDPLETRSILPGPMMWPRREADDRYFFQYGLLKDDLSALERALLRIPRKALGLSHNYRLNTSFGLRFGRRARATPFSPDFRLFAGSYWHIIGRKCA